MNGLVFRKCFKTNLLLLGVALPTLGISANGFTELFGEEGYFVKIPSGDIYLFPHSRVNEARAITQEQDPVDDGDSIATIDLDKKESPNTANNTEQDKSVPETEESIKKTGAGETVTQPAYQPAPFYPPFFQRPGKGYAAPRHYYPNPGYQYFPPQYRGRYSAHPKPRYYAPPPIYLPRFDAAKSLKSGQN